MSQNKMFPVKLKILRKALDLLYSKVAAILDINTEAYSKNDYGIFIQSREPILQIDKIFSLSDSGLLKTWMTKEIAAITNSNTKFSSYNNKVVGENLYIINYCHD